MLEQKETNEVIIEELKDIEKKDAVTSERLTEINTSEECPCCESLNEDKVIRPSFIDNLKATIIDVIVIGGISTVGVFVMDAILSLAGYGVTQKFQMSFIIFMAVMVLYMSIMQSGKNSATLGQKIAGLIITKG